MQNFWGAYGNSQTELRRTEDFVVAAIRRVSIAYRRGKPGPLAERVIGKRKLEKVGTKAS